MHNTQQNNNKRHWFLEFIFGKQCEESNEAHIRQIAYLETVMGELKQTIQTQKETIRELDRTIIEKSNDIVELKATMIVERAEREEAINEARIVKRETGRAKRGF